MDVVGVFVVFFEVFVGGFVGLGWVCVLLVEDLVVDGVGCVGDVGGWSCCVCSGLLGMWVFWFGGYVLVGMGFVGIEGEVVGVVEFGGEDGDNVFVGGGVFGFIGEGVGDEGIEVEFDEFLWCGR